LSDGEFEESFAFYDNSVYRKGLSLTLEELFNFNPVIDDLWNPVERGNGYAFRLNDVNGIPCQVVKNHRGNLRIEPAGWPNT